MKKFCLFVLIAAMSFGWATAASAAVDVAPGGVGDALLGELYMVDDAGFITFFTITNTSDQYVKIHVRLRSGRYSIEVYDYQFELTPHDKTWFQIEMVGGLPYIRGEMPVAFDYYEWPLSNLVLRQVAFAPSDLSEMQVGYIEVFGVGAATEAGEVETQQLDCPNVLLGSVYLGSFDTGEYLGYRMTAFESFRTDLDEQSTEVHRDGYTQGFIDKDIVCYDQTDWATYHGPTWNDGDASAAPPAADGYSGDWSLSDVEAALNKATIASNYFNRYSGGYTQEGGMSTTTTIAAVTFPAKYLHWFFSGWDNEIGDEPAAITARAGLTSPPAAIPIAVAVYDMLENPYEQEPGPSPWPSHYPRLPWEVNLIPVGDLSQDKAGGVTEFPIFVDHAFSAPYAGGFEMGWFRINFSSTISTSWDPREIGIYPATNLVVDSEDINYPHARGRAWHWWEKIELAQ